MVRSKVSQPSKLLACIPKYVFKTDNSKELVGVNFNCIFKQDVCYGVLNLVTCLSIIATRITNKLFNELVFVFKCVANVM